MNRPSRWWLDAGWIVALLTLALWTASRYEVFQIWTNQLLADGSRVRIPFTFAGVDHPFHATRAETLRRSLADGQILRWIMNHQGGYPVEFYPLGAPWIEVIGWAAAFGTLPLMYVHKVVVVAVFLMPIVAFAWIARADRLTLGVAALAGALQVSIRGWWWSGGSMELIEWGLMTNVAGATIVLLALVVLSRGCFEGSRRHLMVAALLLALAFYVNSRSLLPTVATTLGVLLALGLARADFKRGVWNAVLVGSVSAAIAAPLLIPLMRFRDLYFFVPYSGYDSVRAYLDSSVTAVGTPAFLLMLIGLAAAVSQRDRPVSRVVGLTLIVYVVMTAVLGLDLLPGVRIEQLEATRMMPFQRYLMLYLAGYGLWFLGSLLDVRLDGRRLLSEAVLAAATGAVLILYIGGAGGIVPESDRAVVAPVTTAHAEIADLERAIRTADATAPNGTALLVLGVAVSWHDQLWAPQWSDRPFFYDDWLWYWQQDHVGDYDPATAHAYRSDVSALDRDYLETHGIGGVVVTGEARNPAASLPFLNLVERSTTWDVYRVDAPTTIVTGGGQLASNSRIGNEAIAAEFDEQAAVFEVRRNWFPRWQMDGGALTKASSGYLAANADNPTVAVDLQYGVDRWDWLSRLLMGAGLSLAAAWLIRPSFLARPRTGSVRR